MVLGGHMDVAQGKVVYRKPITVVQLPDIEMVFCETPMDVQTDFSLSLYYSMADLVLPVRRGARPLEGVSYQPFSVEISQNIWVCQCRSMRMTSFHTQIWRSEEFYFSDSSGIFMLYVVWSHAAIVMIFDNGGHPRWLTRWPSKCLNLRLNQT